MTLALWYRGVHLEQLILRRWKERKPDLATGLWVLPDGRLMTWNDACAWVDEVVGDEPLPRGYEHALPPFYCEVCGERELLCYYEDVRDRLIATGLCHSCHHWWEFEAKMRREPWRYFVDQGVAYSVGERQRIRRDGYQAHLGFGGAEWVITWPSGHVEDTNNLWCAGEVPAIWRERLPDNATRRSRHDLKPVGAPPRTLEQA